MAHRRSDFLIIGGGIVGVAIATALAEKYSAASIVVIEKEKAPGFHASGRNSGVLHAGFYYTADSLKARFTRNGNQELTAFCKAKGLALNACGKLVVAKDEQEDAVLDILLERGLRNGVSLEMLSVGEAQKIEPSVKTWKRALYSPATAVVDPLQVLSALVDEAVAKGVVFEYGVKYLGLGGDAVDTSIGAFHAGYVVNTAGLYADKVARDFGFSSDYFLLPFKGVYLYGSERAVPLKTNIYPVPDLRNPFLGVHFTLTVQGRIKIGPTAIPAFWPEQYGGLQGFVFQEFLTTSGRHLRLMLAGDAMFRELAIEEMKKYSRGYLVDQATMLADGVRKGDFKQWGRPGIRAQLFNSKAKKLEMDFVIEGDNRSMHVLNAISPAFTCSLPFSRYVVDQISQQLA